MLAGGGKGEGEVIVVEGEGKGEFVNETEVEMGREGEVVTMTRLMELDPGEEVCVGAVTANGAT